MIVMKKYKYLIYISIASTLLFSCGTVKEAFDPNKNSGDEFLVEKKSPLVMPPDYNELPIPNENNEQKDKNDSEFKTLISKKGQDAEADNNQDNNKNIEELILDKIKKN